MYNRFIENRLKRQKKNLLLLGPRQVGKSTLIRRLNPQLSINLADEETFLSHLKDPGLIKRLVLALEKPSLIFIDEIQRIPAMLNTVQFLIDENPATRFVLTGSSARKLRRGKANLLPGRIVTEHLGPLLYGEIPPTEFNLEKIVERGGLPGIYTDDEAGWEVLQSYTQTYLKEEIMAEAATRNIGAFTRFLTIAAESSGQWINYSKLASDAEISKDTLRNYYDLLIDTLLAIKIPAFKPGRNRRRVSQRDRILIFDTGVRNAMLFGRPVTFTPTEWGHLFEQWLLLQVFGFNQVHQAGWEISSFRSDTGVEIDIVLQRAKETVLIEIKSSRKVLPGQLKAFSMFEALTGRKALKIGVYLGELTQVFEPEITIYPLHAFMTEVLPGLAGSGAHLFRPRS